MKSPKNLTERPGLAYRQGKLYLFSRQRITVARFEDPRAWTMSWSSPGKWVGCRPHIDFSRYEMDHPRRWDPPPWEQRRKLDFDPFGDCSRWQVRNMDVADLAFSDIDWSTRNLLSPFPAGQWHALQLAVRVEGGYELLGSNPALGMMLARSAIYHHPAVQRPLRSARALVRKPRTEILAWLGWPPRRWVERMLRRIPPKILTAPRLLALRNIVDVPEAGKALAHLDGPLNSGVLALIADRTLSPLISMRLLEEVASHPDMKVDGEKIANQVRGIRDMRTILARSGRFCGMTPTFRVDSLRQVEAMEAEMQEELNQLGVWKRRIPFPPPPYRGNADGTILPVTTYQELAAIAVRFKNCLKSYTESIVEGRYYVYRTVPPLGKSVFVVRRSTCGRFWRLEKPLGPCNKSVGKSLVAVVEEWFSHARLMVPGQLSLPLEG